MADQVMKQGPGSRTPKNGGIEMGSRDLATALALIACVALGACGGRTIGSGPRDCDPACALPYTCDRTSGSCVCAPGECCVLVDCWCFEGEQHCEGSTLTGCGETAPTEPGACGQICDYPPLEQCPGACVEPEWGLAYCGEDLCGVRGTESYWFALLDAQGGVDDCGQIAGPGPSGIAVQESGEILESWTGGLALRTADGQSVSVEHDLPWHVSNCLFPGRAVTVQLAWASDAETGNYCTQHLQIEDADTGRLLLSAADGAPHAALGGELAVYPMTLDCPGDAGPCGPSAVYRLRFELGGSSVDVYQTESAELAVDGAAYEAHNGRSYFTGECSDTAYGWYVTELCGDG